MGVQITFVLFNIGSVLWVIAGTLIIIRLIVDTIHEYINNRK